MLYRGGLHLAEALALYPRDLNGKRGTVYIHNRKATNRARSASMQRLSASSISGSVKETS